MSGLSAKTKHVQDFKSPVHSSMRSDTHPVWHTCMECCPVSTTVCTNIIYLVWCQVSSLRHVLKSSLLLFFFVFSFYCVMFSFIMQTPLGEEKLLFLCKYSSLFSSSCTVSTLMRLLSELHSKLNPTVQRSCVFHRDEKDVFKWKQQDNHTGTGMTLQVSELRPPKSSREIL